MVMHVNPANIDFDGLFKTRDLDGILDKRTRFESLGCAFEGYRLVVGFYCASD